MTTTKDLTDKISAYLNTSSCSLLATFLKKGATDLSQVL